MRTGLVFKILSRLIPLALFWDLLSVLLHGGLESTIALLSVLRDLYTAIPAVLFYISVFTAIATVLTGSPLLYVLTLVILTTSKYHVAPYVPLASIMGLFGMLVLDAAGFTFREGQGKSVRYQSFIALFGALALSLALLLVYAVPSIFAGYFLSLTLTALRNSSSSIARLLGDNVVFKLLLVAGVSVFAYTSLTRITEVVAVLAYPSRKTALKALSETSDVDIVYRTPLEFLKVLIVASFVAPLLYVILLDYVLPSLLLVFRVVIPRPLLGVLEAWWFKTVLSVIVFTVSWRLISRLISFYEEIKLKGVLVATLITMFIVYVAAVYYNLAVTGDFLRALISPDFGFLEDSVRRVYVDYYVNFVYLLEVASALVGFAP